jgi:hypothetical protein
MTISVSPVSAKTTSIPHDEPQNILRRLALLVAQIYTTFSQISQNERSEIVQLEMNFKSHNIESASMMRSRGNLALGTACLSLMLFAASQGFANVNDKKFVQLAGEKVPEFVRLFDTRGEANIRNTDSLSQLEMTKLQDKNNKSQSDGNIKDQFTQVLQAEIQRLRSASSSAG